jgi:hypothetical protein
VILSGCETGWSRRCLGLRSVAGIFPCDAATRSSDLTDREWGLIAPLFCLAHEAWAAPARRSFAMWSMRSNASPRPTANGACCRGNFRPSRPCSATSTIGGRAVCCVRSAPCWPWRRAGGREHLADRDHQAFRRRPRLRDLSTSMDGEADIRLARTQPPTCEGLGSIHRQRRGLSPDRPYIRFLIRRLADSRGGEL